MQDSFSEVARVFQTYSQVRQLKIHISFAHKRLVCVVCYSIGLFIAINRHVDLKKEVFAIASKLFNPLN